MFASALRPGGLIVAPLVLALSSPALLAPLCAQGSFIESSQTLGFDYEHVAGGDHMLDDPIPAAIMEAWCQSGFALGDLDGDLDPDIVACGSLVEPAVFRNDVTAFVDVTAGSGLPASVYFRSPVLGDYDRDGDLDLYLSALVPGDGPEPGRGRLLRNEGSFVFTDVSVLAGMPGNGHSTMARWVDLDLDGLPDLVTAEFSATANLWYRNNGDGTFTELGAQRGLDHLGTTHVVSAFDSDGDDYPEVFYGNGFAVAFLVGLAINPSDTHLQGLADHSFLDQTAGSGMEQTSAIMGFVVGDVNYDGLMDVYKSDVGPNSLLINNGWPAGTPWTNDSASYGVEADFVPFPDDPGTLSLAVSWGAALANLDLDPWLDLFVVNGQISSQPFNNFARGQHNFLFMGQGPSGGFAFTEIPDPSLGLYDIHDDRAVAAGDLDRDGDLDLLVGAVAGPSRLFLNDLDRNGNGYLTVNAVTNTSMPGGTGTKVSYTDSQSYPHVRMIGVDGNTASQHEQAAHFGLGTESSVDLTVRFPSRMELTLPNTSANQFVTVVEPELISWSQGKVAVRTPGASFIAGGLGAFLAAPQQWISDDLSVTVFAHDSSGNVLDSSAVVTINVPGLVPEGSVEHVTGNEFRRFFRIPRKTGAYRALVTFDGWQVGIEPQLHVYDPQDASGTAASVNTEGLRMSRLDHVMVQVAPKDADGYSLGVGQTLSATLGGTTPTLGPVDMGDGRYGFEFAAPRSPGTHDLDVTVNGTLISALLSVDAAGAADFAQTEVEDEVPNLLNSPLPHQMRMFITPRDANGNRLGRFANVSLVAVPDAGTDPITVRTELSSAQPDGSHVFVIEKPDVDPPAVSTGVLQLSVDGTYLGDIAYGF